MSIGEDNILNVYKIVETANGKSLENTKKVDLEDEDEYYSIASNSVDQITIGG